MEYLDSPAVKLALGALLLGGAALAISVFGAGASKAAPEVLTKSGARRSTPSSSKSESKQKGLGRHKSYAAVVAAAPAPVAAPVERHSAAKQDALSRTKKPTAAAAAGKGDAAEKFESDPIWNPNSGERAKQLKAIPLSSAERAAQLTAPVAAPPVVDAKALAKKEKRQQRAAAAAVEAATIQAAIDAANGDADHDWHVVAPKKTTKKVDTALPVEA